MRIRWVLSALGVDARHPTLPWASYRYRAKIPMRELAARGHACDWLPLRHGEIADAALDGVDALVFAKNHTERDEVLALLERARARAVPTVVDTCDDYFEPGHALAPYYWALVALATGVTTSSFQLAAAIEDATDVEAHVVRDPFEGPRGEPHWAPAAGGEGAVVRHAAEPSGFARPASTCRGASSPRVWRSSCSPAIGRSRADFRGSSTQMPGQGRAALADWSLQGNWEALRDCDLGLIPVNRNERFALAKGPNRLVETLWAGRYALDQLDPGVRGVSTVGVDRRRPCRRASVVAGAPGRSARENRRGPGDIARHYSPQAAAAEWEAALSAAIGRA